MPVYVMIFDYEQRTVVEPPKEEEYIGLLGRLVYPDPFSALKAARHVREALQYGWGMESNDIIRIHELDADWETDTIEVPDRPDEEPDFPIDIEPAMASFYEHADVGRYLTKTVTVGREIKAI